MYIEIHVYYSTKNQFLWNNSQSTLFYFIDNKKLLSINKKGYLAFDDAEIKQLINGKNNKIIKGFVYQLHAHFLNYFHFL